MAGSCIVIVLSLCRLRRFQHPRLRLVLTTFLGMDVFQSGGPSSALRRAGVERRVEGRFCCFSLFLCVVPHTVFFGMDVFQ